MYHFAGAPGASEISPKITKLQTAENSSRAANLSWQPLSPLRASLSLCLKINLKRREIFAKNLEKRLL